MEKYLWRLLTALFLLLAAVVLGMMAVLFQGVSLIMGLCFYTAVGCGLLGITKGLLVIIDYHREYKDGE